jgi:hypothetical protein
MRDQKNTVIAVLSGLAVLLVAVLIVLYGNQPALGSVTVTAGDYSAASFSVSSGQDYMAVVDNPTKRMIIYRFDRNRKRIEVVDSRDLSKDLKSE